MLLSLPADADPQLRNPFDTVALLAHACMLVVGFRLEGLGEDRQIGRFMLHCSIAHQGLMSCRGKLRRNGCSAFTARMERLVKP